MPTSRPAKPPAKKTAKKTAKRPAKRPAKKAVKPAAKKAAKPAAAPLTDAARLLAFFAELLPLEALLLLPSLAGHTFYKRLFTPPVTLWLLLFQRLNADHTLDAAHAHARAGGADAFNPRLSKDLRSESTCSYSTARGRLPVALVLEALRFIGSKICGLDPSTLWNGLRVALLDGSTTRLHPHGDIPKHFPPHRNQRGRGYWCLMRVVVTFCARTGAALDCAMGSTAASEQALGIEIILRAAAGCLFVGDRNFGIFSVASAARSAGQQVLLRMTRQRAASLLGRAPQPGDHAVLWKPGRHDKLPAGAGTEPVEGRLVAVRIKRRGHRDVELFLFTTLGSCTDFPAAELVGLYGLRWQIEVDLRLVKAQMDAAQLEVQGADMARKEWLACLVAYNLVSAGMNCAAVHAGIPPMSLSFSSCRRRLEGWLREYGRGGKGLRETWARLLKSMGQCRHPRRSKPRPNEPRAQRHIRQTHPPLIGSRAKARRALRKHARKS